MGLKKTRKNSFIDLYAYPGVHDEIIKFWKALKQIKSANKILCAVLSNSLREGKPISLQSLLSRKSTSGAQDKGESNTFTRIRLYVPRDKGIIWTVWDEMAPGYGSSVFLMLIQNYIDQHLGKLDLNLVDFFQNVEEVVLSSEPPDPRGVSSIIPMRSEEPDLVSTDIGEDLPETGTYSLEDMFKPRG